jgi:hypothetical protein
MGNDLLDVKANPLVFGDEDSDVLVGADMAFSEAADPLTLSPRALADLMAVEEERDDGQPTVQPSMYRLFHSIAAVAQPFRSIAL